MTLPPTYTRESSENVPPCINFHHSCGSLSWLVATLVMKVDTRVEHFPKIPSSVSGNVTVSNKVSVQKWWSQYFDNSLQAHFLFFSSSSCLNCLMFLRFLIVMITVFVLCQYSTFWKNVSMHFDSRSTSSTVHGFKLAWQSLFFFLSFYAQVTGCM